MIRCVGTAKRIQRSWSTFAGFSDLKQLMQQEIQIVGPQLQKLTSHPLLDLLDDLKLKRQILLWEEILHLTSKAFGLGKEFHVEAYDATTGILHNQRTLVRITQMLYVGCRIHRSILSVYNRNGSDDVHIGNRLSLLTGDYLLCSGLNQLSSLRCNEVSELMSSCLRDLSEAEFIEPRTKKEEPLPAKPRVGEKLETVIPDQPDDRIIRVDEVLGRAKPEWTLRHLLGGASVLAKSCQATLRLAGLPQCAQRLGYQFGHNIALVQQANDDILAYERGKVSCFSLINAPLMFHLEHDPSYYEELVKNVHNAKYDEIKDEVRSGPGLERTIDLSKGLKSSIVGTLREFPDNSSRRALFGLIKTL